MIIIDVSIFILACCIFAALLRIEAHLSHISFQAKASTEFLQEISFLLEKNGRNSIPGDKNDLSE